MFDAIETNTLNIRFRGFWMAGRMKVGNRMSMVNAYISLVVREVLSVVF
jgi:hypothetical protein